MTENHNLSVLYTFVRALQRAGIEDVCISPGSRSTPLTLAFVRTGAFHVWTLLDERSAGYFAVGLARVGRPAALVCTSGGATANYHPAVMEAYASRLPLVVLTADRPPELQEVGANQTIHQSQLYGTHVKWQIQMPVPEDIPLLHRQAEATAWRLAQTARAKPEGPVHLNWPLREPLVPPLENLAHAVPVTVQRAFAAVATPHPDAVSEVIELMQTSGRGLLVCGPQPNAALADAVLALAAAWHVPVIADVLSQVRSVGHVPADAVVADVYDLWLRDSNIVQQLQPDWVLRFGATPTSKALNQFLGSCTTATQVAVDEAVNWRDPGFVVNTVVQGDPVLLCSVLTERGETAAAGDDWTQRWQRISERARAAVHDAAVKQADAAVDEAGSLAFEGQVFAQLAAQQMSESILFLGNSMPVRDADSFLPLLRERVPVLANRGVSGIDGVISSAVGVAAGSQRRTVLVIGDVSFYHDQNGLLAARQFGVDLTIILINNDGGGIFSFLPQAAYPETFAHFRTAHGLDFEHTVQMYGGTFHRPDTWEAFAQRLDLSRQSGGLQVIELRTDMQRNVAYHDQLVSRVQAAVRAALE